MSYFSPDFLEFFKNLAANNDRDWFHANKKRYETSVKQPFEAFIGDLIKAAQTVDDRISIEPKQAIFRIHRDVRFSQDKSPYKIYASAVVSPVGRHKIDVPSGFYLEIHPEHFHLYSGLYQVDKDGLERVRTGIAANLDEFARLIHDAEFVEHFGAIRGERHKRLPKELQTAAEQQPLLYNKQFYYFTEMPLEWLETADLIEKVIARYRISKKVSDFLERIY